MNKIKYEEIKKNKRLTSFEDLKNTVIESYVKHTIENQKKKDKSKQELLISF